MYIIYSMEQNLSVLMSSLANSWKTKDIDNKYHITELTLNQQQAFLATAFDQYDKPAKTWKAFNNVINECVSFLTAEKKNITVLERPYLIRELRDLTLGNKLTKVTQDEQGEEKKTEYTLKKIKFSDLDKIKTTETISVTPAISITLTVPDLQRDNFINQQLLNQLNNIKRNASANRQEVNPGEITVLYYHYELIKFINSITVNDIEYDFKNMLPSEQLHAIKSLNMATTTKIGDFIQSIKKFEELAFTGINKVTGEEEVFQMDQTIFSKEV